MRSAASILRAARPLRAPYGLHRLLLLGPLLLPTPAAHAGGHAAGVDTIRVADIEVHLENVASPLLEGRDSPSPGLERAAEYISGRFAQLSLAYAPDSLELLREHGGEPGTDATGSYLRPFTRPLEAPVPAECRLAVAGAEPFVYGRDFVPVVGCNGQAEGELVFAGFGIEDRKERYDDFRRLRLAGRVALIFEGEPRNPRRFGGQEPSPAASLWSKLERLIAEDVAGVLVVRRPWVDVEAEGLDYRYSFAVFLGEPPPRAPRRRPPVLEITYEAATRLLGRDARELAERIDKSVRPVQVDTRGVEVSLSARTALADVRVDNVVAVLPGSDPDLREEYVVVGAHYDHVGVDLRGRIGPGADDNGSGVAGLLEVAQAMATARPRRSILFCAFGAEEAGLLGSQAFTARLPVERRQLVAMINMDMIGRGDAREVAVLGCKQNPALERVLKRAADLSRTGVRDVVTSRGDELWSRSDHFSFHKIGVPVLFFFEGLPISRNPDYHTWRDTIERLDLPKIENTAKLVFNTAWLLANDDERPPPPRD